MASSARFSTANDSGCKPPDGPGGLDELDELDGGLDELEEELGGADDSGGLLGEDGEGGELRSLLGGGVLEELQLEAGVEGWARRRPWTRHRDPRAPTRRRRIRKAERACDALPDLPRGPSLIS